MGSGLWPMTQDVIHDTRSMDSYITFQVETTSDAENVHSPRKILREALVNAIAPPVSKETDNALEIPKRRE